MIDAAIEQAARRLDVWAAGGADSCAGAWYIYGRRGSGTYSIQMFGAAPGWRDFPSPTAALFLLLLGLPEVAVTCPDCQDRSATGGKLARWECRPECWGAPVGRVQREPARLFLDAARMATSDTERRGHEPALAVLADQLQAHGDQRGTWVALWLAGPEAFAQVLGEVEAELRSLINRLDVERHRALVGGFGCTCDTNPETTDGPSQDCPHHGIDRGPASRRPRAARPALAATL